MGDLDGQRYPRSCMSSSHLHMAIHHLGSSGYTLQLMVSGASGLSTIAWSQGHNGGNHCASSLLNTLAWHQYSAGISVAFWYCLVVMVSSVAVVWMVNCLRSSCTILCGFSTSWVHVIVIWLWWWWWWTVWRTMGSAATSIVAVPQVIGGLNMVSQGYPKIMSSPPRLVTRKCMILQWFLVCTSRSM